MKIEIKTVNGDLVVSVNGECHTFYGGTVFTAREQASVFLMDIQSEINASIAVALTELKA